MKTPGYNPNHSEKIQNSDKQISLTTHFLDMLNKCTYELTGEQMVRYTKRASEGKPIVNDYNLNQNKRQDVVSVYVKRPEESGGSVYAILTAQDQYPRLEAELSKMKEKLDKALLQNLPEESPQDSEPEIIQGAAADTCSLQDEKFRFAELTGKTAQNPLPENITLH